MLDFLVEFSLVPWVGGTLGGYKPYLRDHFLFLIEIASSNTPDTYKASKVAVNRLSLVLVTFHSSRIFVLGLCDSSVAATCSASKVRVVRSYPS